VLTRFQEFPVVVVEQADNLPFNRGALLNIGYVRAREQGARRVIMHDCDLVPDDTMLSMYREHWPSSVIHFGARFRRYNNSNRYFGGVHGFYGGSFPGYPNNFWGWGGEDDALRKRVPESLSARRGEYLDLEGYTQARDKLDALRPEDKCNNRWELLSSDDQRRDNHRRHGIGADITWEHVNGIEWGCITLRREA